MDTDPKIVGRENRPHMNALVHRTFGYGPLEATRSLSLTRMRPMLFAKHVISLAVGWSTGSRRIVTPLLGGDATAGDSNPGGTFFTFGKSRFFIYTTPNPNRVGHTQVGHLNQGRRSCRTRAPRSRRHVRGVRHARAQNGRRDRDHTRREG